MNRLIGLLSCLLAFTFSCKAQYTVDNTELRYQLKLSDSLVQWKDSAATADHETVYYDNYSGIVLMVTAKEGLFTNSQSYIDCSKEDLEQRLKEYQGDSTLRLISCNKSKYYPSEAVLLHFESHIYPAGLNRCIIYFIHHDGHELQFSFVYDKAAEGASLAYIDRIMQTLKLY